MQTVFVDLGLKLEDIPDPTPCPACGGTSQKEYLEFEERTDKAIVVADSVPGYGCIKCGVKTYDSVVSNKLLKQAAKELKLVGDLAGSDRMSNEARLLEQVDQRYGKV